MKSRRARIIAATVIMASAGAGAVSVALTSAHATSKVVTDRFAGLTRYDTARLVAISKPAGAGTGTFGAPTSAVVASGDNFPDALSASYLAGAYQSPTLLTSTSSLRDEAVQGLKTLGVKNVTIVGGTNAISSNQDAQLSADGFTVNRIAGDTRDATAANVAQSGNSVGTYRGLGLTAILANDSSDHYVDALAGGPMSWAGHLPLLLTPTATLAPEAATALTNLKIKHVVILGGTAAVSSDVESAVSSMGITTERLFGTDRQLTAVAVANAEHQNLAFTLAHVTLAVGNNFPDALAGGPYGGIIKAPILLTGDPNTLTTDTDKFFVDNDGTINHITVFGGTNAVSDQVLNQAAGDATCNGGSNAGGPTTTSGGTGLPLIGGPIRAAAATTTSTTVTSGSTTSTSLPPCTTTTTAGATTTSAANSGSTTTAGGGGIPVP